MPKQILLIDDSTFILDTVSKFIETAGYKVFTALDGEQGIQIAIKEIPDLILCDVNMPGLSGFDVIEQIRTNKITASIPFIFLTALAEKEVMREGMIKGADDYLTKPFKKQELLDAINAQWKRNARIAAIVDTRMKEIFNLFEKKIAGQINDLFDQIRTIEKKYHNMEDINNKIL